MDQRIRSLVYVRSVWDQSIASSHFLLALRYLFILALCYIDYYREKKGCEDCNAPIFQVT